MSRNLGRSDCYYCASTRIVYEEAPRPITRADAGVYIDEYEGCIVAAAHCYECEARYLAWFDKSAHGRRFDYGHGRTFSLTEHCDLSFRSSFDDEPGVDDVPRWNIVVVRERKRLETCADCGVVHATAVPCTYVRPGR